MAEPVEFYFDFSSPYAYFAAQRIDRDAARFGRTVVWKPIMLGPAFKASGNAPLVEQPLKGAYSKYDWARMARFMGVPYAFPDPFPVATLAPARAFWSLADNRPELAHAYAKAVFHAYFAEGRDISRVEVAVAVGEALGLDPAALAASIQDPVWKQRTKDETDQAIAKGVFGAPFFFIDGEPFWGADRLWMIRKWLERGGW